MVLTSNRVKELLRSLSHLHALRERPRIIVVDNGSTDGTPVEVAQAFPDVVLVCARENLGAAGRNLGVERVITPFVAFCDDDCWWEDGVLAAATDLLSSHPRIAVLSARVLVGPEAREDPTCERMAHSPLPSAGLPGPALARFLAGACAMRTDCFRAAGGYYRELFIGAEESLLALDLMQAGWQIVYARDLVVHHWPSSQRESGARRLLLARNEICVAWLRLPWPDALRTSWRVLEQARVDGLGFAVSLAVLRQLAWIRTKRRVVSDAIAQRWRDCSTT